MNLSIAITFLLSSAARVKGDNYIRSSISNGGGVAGAEECGGENGACVPLMEVRDYEELNKCFQEKFPNGRKQLVTLLDYPDISDGEKVEVYKITDPRDGTDFEKARYNFGYGLRWPAAIVYAEDEDDVKGAIMCATKAGYNISPRGRGHSYQGLSLMDGHVVIDCSLLCNPDEFTLDRTEDDWLLPGQKMIGSIKNGPGCTNAVMLAYAHKNFEPEEGAIYQIGTCPSVGIVGYSTGGGAGDTTRWVGWGVDDVLGVEMILYNGTKVTASKDENTDLFWAIRGGGSGLGVVTSMHTAVIASPDPPEGMDRRFCRLIIHYKTEDDDARKEFLNALQEFIYENPDSNKYGGGADLGRPSKNDHVIHGMFLGSKEEFFELFSKSGILNSDTLDKTIDSKYLENYEEIPPPEGMPAFGLEVSEFNSYGEAMVYKMCKAFEHTLSFAFTMTASSLDWCKDLNISADNCVTKTFADHFGKEVTLQFPVCEYPEVVEAIVNAAYDPSSFFNRPGMVKNSEASIDGHSISSSPGGLLIPKVNVKVLNEMVEEASISVNHWQHGAPMSVPSDETGWAWRDTAIMAAAFNGNEYETLTTILANKHYKDANKIQGYYNYMNPIGNPNWRYYYFGDNYDRLSEIKAKYDPMNYFGNPQAVEPAVPKESSTETSAKASLSTK